MTRPAYLIAHTHWDREWYRTFQQFRLDLVRTVDRVLDTLEQDPAFTHFLLDGQTIVLDDYLAMRPERAAALRRHIASGRLAVGPWYCHPDLFLVSGESLLRNLMLGLRMARSYGRALMVGYAPDQFGHTGQLPQILRGVGIDSAVVWRGVDNRTTQNESWWEAPDGSRVFLALLAQSYSNAQMLPLNAGALATRLRQFCDLLAPGATGPGVLLMNGGDHLPIQPDLPALLDQANPLLAPDWRVELTDLTTAVARLRDDGRPEQTLRGELRSSATAHLLPGVLSARLPLKQRNARAQTLLEREVEPYASWASLLGAPYPHGEIWEAWRLLLQNQPHDSICGCSIDQVPREMATRYDGVDQIGAELVARALSHVAAHADTRLPAGAPSHTVPLVIFNPASGPRTERMSLAVQLPGVVAGYELIDAAGQPVPHIWRGATGEPSTTMDVPRESIPPPAAIMALVEGNRVLGMGLQGVTTHVTDGALHLEATVGDNNIMAREELENEIWRIHGVMEETAPLPIVVHLHYNASHELELLARDIPAFGYTTLWLRPLDDASLGATADVAAGNGPRSAPHAHRIENELVAVEADATTGALTLHDRRTGHRYGPCNAFVDGGDAGDTYTYAPPALDTVVDRPATAPRITATLDDLGAHLHITQELIVPAGLAAERTARAEETTTLTISSDVTLTDGNPRVDITTTVHNTAQDHRLQVRFTAPFTADHVHAAGAYEVVRRAIDVPDAGQDAVEAPVREAPQHDFVLLHDGGCGLAIANVGLPEYAAECRGDATTVTVTLLRCVGWLSRDDLTTRRGGAGPSLPVPEAQLPGTYTFSYSLLPFSDPWLDAVDAAQHAAVALRAVTTPPAEGRLPATGQLIAVEGRGIQLSAVKGAEQGDAIVVRLYNVADQATHGTLRLFRPATRVETVTLDERPLGALHDGAGVTSCGLELAPHQIVTLRLTF